MKTCPTCGAELDRSARTCPKCGKSFTTASGVILAIVIGILVAGLLGVVAF